VKRHRVSWLTLMVGFAFRTAVAAPDPYATPNVATPTNQAPVLDAATFLNPPTNVRPKYRWWVTVADMEDEEIAAELQAMKEAGAGGAEIVVFPGDNTSAEYLRTYGFGGPLWNHKVEVIQTEAANRGLTVDHTVSPGWPGSKVVAGATEPYSINDIAVAKQLVYGSELALPGETYSGPIPTPGTRASDSPFGFPADGQGFGGEPGGAPGGAGPGGAGGAPGGAGPGGAGGAPGGAGPGGGAPAGAQNEPADEAERVLIRLLAIQCASPCTDSGANLDAGSAIDLTGEVQDGSVTFKFPSGNGLPWQLMAFYYTADGATASHAYTSPVYIVDHLSKEGVYAFRDFWTSNAFGNNPDHGFNSTATQAGIEKSGGGAMFEDSLELSATIKWTPRMMERWEELRGYSLLPYLPALISVGRQGTEPSSFVFGDGMDARIRNDYRQTWSDLFISEHLETMREWTHALGMETRLQAYGDPLVVPSVMAHVDMPEGECNMGFPEVGKFIAVGAHMQDGRTVVSSENCAIAGQVWNTLIGGTGRTANLPAAYRTYAGGVTQHVWHGFGYITSDSMNGTERVWPWHAGFNHLRPGWAETWAPVLPQWQAGHIKELNDNLARHSLVTRQGQPRFDIAIYWQGFGIGSNGGTRPAVESRVTSTGPLAQQGYTHEYITDEFLNVPSYGSSYVHNDDLDKGAFFPTKSAYKALILNNQLSIDRDSAEHIFVLAKESGLPVVVIGNFPATTPGAYDVAAQDADVKRFMTDTSSSAMRKRSSLASLVDVDGYNVRHVDTLEDAVSALQQMGIMPAAYHDSHRGATDTASAIVSLRRETGDTNYYLLFNQTNNRVDQRLTLSGDGQPYRLDTWSGTITPLADYERTENGVTIGVELAGQDTAVFALSTQALGDGVASRRVQNGDAIRLGDWTLQVEGFSADADRAEDSLPGIEHTRRTQFDIGSLRVDNTGSIPPWSRINTANGYAVDLTDISGIGSYATTFTLDEGWDDGRGAFLDLGSATDSVSVIVNGNKLPPVNQQDLHLIDIGPYLEAGENTMTVVVATTLINAVRIAPGTNAESRNRNPDYGLTGPVRLLPYDLVTDM